MSVGLSTLAQIMDDMENGVFDFTKDGKCIGCGSCCSNFLPMTIQEVRNIQRYVSKHHIEECKHIGAPVAKPIWDLTCPFLDTSKPNNKCRIYSHRPQICRAFMCNVPPSKVDETKKAALHRGMIVDVRETFFGEEDE